MNSIDRISTSKKKFIYKFSKGGIINNNKLLNNINKLAIPPSWKLVKIFPNSRKIIAYGLDKKGRKQYIYNKIFTRKRSKKKYSTITKLIKDLPKLRKKFNKSLKSKDPIEKLSATVISIMDRCCPLRVGNQKYKDENSTYGLTTLEKKHIKFGKDKFILDFNGKKNIRNICQCNDKVLTSIIRHNIKKNSKLIFNLPNSNKSLTATDVNNYIKQYGNYTSKDLRTAKANIYMIEQLRKIGLPTDKKTTKKNLNTAIKNVAKKLSHTQTICKKNYISSKLLKLYNKNYKKIYKILKYNKKNDIAFLKIMKI